MTRRTTIHPQLATLLALPLLAAGGCRNTGNGEESATSKPDSLRVMPAGINYPNGETFKAGDVPDLLKHMEDDAKDATELKIISSATTTVEEPDLVPNAVVPSDLKVLGYKQSRFLVDSRWATIRFLGDNPAGAGKSGPDMDEAQRQAFGKRNDTTPVITAAWTVNRIMRDFFVPMLESIPTGKEVLKAFKIQGAYFAPGFSPSEGRTERDNAFITGLESLYIWPSSCFERGASTDCPEPFLGTGHDPTIIGHETTHAVFNHLRMGKSLDGLQWAAVNEGMADYFSAAYFSEPLVGRIWKVSNRNHPYLRRLTETATTDDPRYATEAHQYGIVWGSTLWRIRARLVDELKAPPREVDRTMLYAITFLGETNKIRLGDAASAVLKAAEALDHVAWKNVMREEFKTAAIALASNQLAANGAEKNRDLANGGAGKSPLNIATKEQPRQVCGSIAGSRGLSGLVAGLIAAAPIVIALLLSGRRRSWRTR
jgi:hypothetical protein